MPEGPEVQVIVDSLQPFVGKFIEDFQLFNDRGYVFRSKPEDLISKKIISISRVGKFIDVLLDNLNHFVIHLSFTGRFANVDTRLYMACRFKIGDRHLFYSDPRGLSKLEVFTPEQYRQHPSIKIMGIDGLKSSIDEIYVALSNYQRRRILAEVKPFLLSFSHISGIGNIYGSEICFDAKIPPTRKFKDLSDEELRRLAKSIHEVLTWAYLAGGSSIKDFVHLDGKIGRAQLHHKVYDKSVCLICRGPISRIKQAERSTFFCPICQNTALSNGRE